MSTASGKDVPYAASVGRRGRRPYNNSKGDAPSDVCVDVRYDPNAVSR